MPDIFVTVHRFRVQRLMVVFYSHAFSIPACLASLASGQEELTNQQFKFSVNPEPLNL
jgi:hypothetical protein